MAADPAATRHERCHPYSQSVSAAVETPVPPECVAALRTIVGNDGVLAGEQELLVYECDGYTLEKHLPGVVVLPHTTEEVVAVVKLCAQHNLPIIPRGAGTSLSGSVLAVTGGVHGAVDVVKAVMAGAHAVQMVSSLLRRGPAVLSRTRDELARWLEEHEYNSLRQMQGSLSAGRGASPAALERVHYMRVLHSWRPGDEEPAPTRRPS